jgi:chromosome segregation ATPase
MNQEKFISSYIDLLNSTLTEAIQKNLTILAQKNVIEQELNEVKSTVNNESKSLKDVLQQRDKEINDLKNQLNDARRQKDAATGETNELKKNVQHIETFKSELVKSRNEINRLNELLQDKDKIIDSLNRDILVLIDKQNKKEEEKDYKPVKKSVKKILEQPVETVVVKDAGSF